jgi:recombination protein RecA
MKIGVMFGNPETTTGGNALKFYASVRLEVRKIETLSKGTDNIVGNRVRVKVVKNKVAPPFKKVEMDLMFGKGISYVGSILDASIKYDLIDKSGSWYSYKDEKIGQGKDNATKFLEGNPDVIELLDGQLRRLMFPSPEDIEEQEKKAAIEAEAIKKITKKK